MQEWLLSVAKCSRDGTVTAFQAQFSLGCFISEAVFSILAWEGGEQLRGEYQLENHSPYCTDPNQADVHVWLSYCPD